METATFAGIDTEVSKVLSRTSLVLICTIAFSSSSAPLLPMLIKPLIKSAWLILLCIPVRHYTNPQYNTSLSFSPIDIHYGDPTKKNIPLSLPQAPTKHLFLQLSFISKFLKITLTKGQKRKYFLFRVSEDP